MNIKKPTINFVIDSISFIAFIFLAASGILMRYILPPGSGRFYSIWGLSRHNWGTIHFWIALLLLGILSLHLLLHWDWIVCKIRGRKCEDSTAKLRVIIGIFALVALLALALSPIISPVQKNESRGRGFRHGRNSFYYHSTGKNKQQGLQIRKIQTLYIPRFV